MPVTLARTVVFVGCLAVGAVSQADDQPLTFEAAVRPILKTHCFQCHGEAGEKEAGLDLRLRRFIVAGGESGSAIKPGHPAGSLLFKRVLNGEMPPGKKRLAADEIARIKMWIEGGAKTARAEPEVINDGPVFTEEERNWWAFQPVTRPPVPNVADAQVRSPVDAFVLARLRETFARKTKQTMGYSHEAGPETLVRRATFNLLGVPPTPEEVGRFRADKSPEAWERLVDRLLASPHFGERWGRHWLDVAGYADSEGYTDADTVRDHAFRYRDYVIRTFNNDKPFNQFVVEQLAGDELAGPTGELTAERIELLTATGFLRMAPDGTGAGGVDQNLARNQVMADTLQIVATSLLGLTVHCAQCHDHRYDPISQVDYYRMRAIFEPAMDWKSWKKPAERRVSLYTKQDGETRTRIEAEAKKVDDERQARVDYYITKTLEQELLLVPDENRDPLRTAYRTDAKKRTKQQKKLLEDYPTVGRLSPGALYLYDRRRDARAKDIETKRAEKEREFLAAAMKSNPDVTSQTLAKVNPAAAASLAVYTQAAAEIRKDRIRNELQQFTDKATAVRATIPKEHFIRVLTETPGKLPDTHFFFRGDHEQPMQKLEPASLSILADARLPRNDPNLATSGRRLRFAQHLTSGQHPLVARVFVNRLWMHLFGRGLVNSPADFGVLGQQPTHPQLLDWLADEFVTSGWSVKQLLRLVMTSSVYRQSARSSARLIELDPENRYYGRRSIRRVEGEILRDAVLAVSGTLNTKIYGEPVPVMEDAVGQIVIGKENLDGERKPTKAIPLNGEEFRRSVYVQVRRTRTLGILETFDAPAMSPNCDRRRDSNVAPQSLMLMNSDFALTYSKQFAQRLIAASTDVREQLRLGWRLAFGREPTAAELSDAERYLTLQRQTVQQSSPKVKPADVQLRALATYCQALMSSNPFLHVE